MVIRMYMWVHISHKQTQTSRLGKQNQKKRIFTSLWLYNMGAKRDIKSMLFRFVLVALYIVLGAAIFYGIEHSSGDGGGEYHKEVVRF